MAKAMERTMNIEIVMSKRWTLSRFQLEKNKNKKHLENEAKQIYVNLLGVNRYFSGCFRLRGNHQMRVCSWGFIPIIRAFHHEKGGIIDE